MIIIDYPPGGLGNFLAQVVTNTIDLNYQQPSFHRNRNTYDTLSLDTPSDFAQAWPDFVPTSDVFVIHSFGQLDLVRRRYPQSTIIQVVVGKEIAIYMNNMYRKACADNSMTESTLHKYLIQHYGADSTATRRENYALSYLHFLHNQDYHNTPSDYADIIINFDNLYQGFERFQLEINKIKHNDIPSIFKVFVETQNIIISRTKLYQDIVNGTKNYQECAEHFDTIDHGLLAGMLQDKYNQEFFLPNQETFSCSIPRADHVSDQ